MTRTLGRRVIGLVAAYAIALQALLGAALPLRASGALGEICIGSSDRSLPTAPAHDADIQCCVAMGCQGGAVVGADDIRLEFARYPSNAAHAIAGAVAFASVPLGRPNWPRAPPFA
jgi:hypothetical protein